MAIKFLGGTVTILVVYALGGWGVYIVSGSQIAIQKALIYSGVLASVFAMVTFFSTVIVSGKAKSNFNKVFLTTLGIRFFVMLAVIIIFLKYVSLDRFTFVVSLFILYFLFQLWEVYIIHTQLRQD